MGRRLHLSSYLLRSIILLEVIWHQNTQKAIFLIFLNFSIYFENALCTQCTCFWRLSIMFPFRPLRQFLLFIVVWFNHNRRGLVSSVSVVCSRKSLGSHPRSKMKTWKIFLRRLPLCRFLSKNLRVNKNLSWKKFLKNLSFLNI